MPQLVMDMSEFTRAARRFHHAGSGQVPFALANSINNGLFDARREIVGTTFPASFDVRNRSFARAAFRVEKASKGALSGSLYDRLGRGHLAKHAEGGVKRPSSGSLAIPSRRIAKFRGARGIAKGKRPRAFKNTRTIRVTSEGIFRGEGGRLVQLYFFAPQARLTARFPFYPVFEREVVMGIRKAFPMQLRRALASRR